MTPELSRHLAHLANIYESHKGADLDLSLEFRDFVRKNETRIESLIDIPDRFNPIVSLMK